MINTNKTNWINPYHKNYYARPNTSAKYKQWTPADMMKRYKKNLKQTWQPTQSTKKKLNWDNPINRELKKNTGKK